MGRISNYPFPSFTLVLTSARVVIPGPSFVLRIEPPISQNVPNVPLVANIDASDKQHAEELHLDLNLRSDSESAVEDDDYDAETITDDLSDLETEGTGSEATVDSERMSFISFFKKRHVVLTAVKGFFRQRSSTFTPN